METQETIPFVKKLAANDRPTRDAALLSLRTYLSGRRNLTSTELLKCWKGLFYCLWMSDRARTQQALCNSLADLVSVVPAENTIAFLRAFWQTMQREWTNIDVLRMEKFLLLVRRYVGASFSWMQVREGHWDGDRVRLMVDLWRELPCNIRDTRVPNGMRYHFIDVFVDELQRLGALDEKASGIPIDELLQPLRDLVEASPTKTVRLKAREAVNDERLSCREKINVGVTEDQVEQEMARGADEEEEWGGIED